MPSLERIDKPANAGWRAKIVASPDGHVKIAPAADEDLPHDFDVVEIAWYGQDRIKITLKDGGPAQIRQAYLPGVGQSVVLDLVRGPTIA